VSGTTQRLPRDTRANNGHNIEDHVKGNKRKILNSVARKDTTKMNAKITNKTETSILHRSTTPWSVYDSMSFVTATSMIGASSGSGGGSTGAILLQIHVRSFGHRDLHGVSGHGNAFRVP
jgi:hypothetical protein